MYIFLGRGVEEGLTNERSGTDHEISGPMSGLGKNCIRWRRHPDEQTSRHHDSLTELAQWGRFSEHCTILDHIRPYYNILEHFGKFDHFLQGMNHSR